MNSTLSTANPWFVVWTEARAEKKVGARLTKAGFDAWVPVIKERHRWSDRWREIDIPLFPGYLFAKTGDVDWSRVLRLPGVLTVIKKAGKPAFLSNDFVAELRDIIERPCVSLEPVPDHADFVPGDEVIVQDGPLAGVRGVVRERRGSRQLVIWVTEIGRGVALTIGSAVVKKTEAS